MRLQILLIFDIWIPCIQVEKHPSISHHTPLAKHGLESGAHMNRTQTKHTQARCFRVYVIMHFEK